MNTTLIRNVVDAAAVGYPFRGVFALDRFMEAFTKDPTGAYIFNTHTSDKPGEHWLATVMIDNVVIFFDSYGFSKSRFVNIKVFLKSNCPKLKVANTVCLQGFGSTTCGDYCVLFTILMLKSWSCEQFYISLQRESNAHIRDHHVRKLMKHIIKVLQVPITSKSMEDVHIQQVQPFCYN